MLGVLTGFGIVLALIGVGYALGRARVLGPDAERVLTRFAFNAALPALLFSVVAPARIEDILTPQFAALAAAAVTAIIGFLGIGAWRGWGLLPTAVGALGAGYANAGNLGIPVAVYVLGSAAPIVPVMLMQLLVIAPVTLGVLDILTGGGPRLVRLLAPLRNPVVVAAALALLCSLTRFPVPGAVLQTVELLGSATVPVMLTAFGLGLRGQSLRLASPVRGQALLAVGLKLVLAPLVAWSVGMLLHLSPTALLQAVVCATLPSAQNVYVYALRYSDTGAHALARAVVLLSTMLSLPAILGVILLLGHG